jgi:hypothetical protein
LSDDRRAVEGGTVHDEDSHVGWDAIHSAMTALHGPQDDAPHWVLDVSLGALDPRLESLSAYDAGDSWHFVTVGLSDVWDARCHRSELSGLGFEFTMRVRKPRRLFRRGHERPPLWAIPLLKRLGDLAMGGAAFRPGATFDPGGPITGQPDSPLVAVGFVVDPSLRTVTTPNGTLSFIQVVGLTANELDDVRAGTLSLRALCGHDGQFVIDTRL